MSLEKPIQVEGLSHYFGKGALRKQILFDITTDIPQGKIVIITGPSGSGKTTFLTIMGALRSAQEGSVRVLGDELFKANNSTLERVRRRIGFIFQQHNLLQALTAEQNVELGLRVSGKHSASTLRARSREMLAAVGLADRMGYKPDQLSGGQRQRVAIARALVSEPSMLLADEPTASLDKHSGREVVDRMKTLANEHGTTIVMVTHDNRILDVADRIIHLEDGKLSTFSDAVIANTQQMMSTLADMREKEDIDQVISGLDETEFNNLLQTMTDEARRFLETMALGRDRVFGSMMERSLFAFTRRIREMLNADRASLFLVDHENQSLLLRITEGLPDGVEIRIPIGTGIAGAVAESGESIRIPDAYSDPRFNPDVDRKFNYKTRSILCLPIADSEGTVFAVAQLLNRKDGQPWEASDEQKFSSFIDSLGVILQTIQTLSSTK